MRALGAWQQTTGAALTRVRQNGREAQTAPQTLLIPWLCMARWPEPNCAEACTPCLEQLLQGGEGTRCGGQRQRLRRLPPLPPLLANISQQLSSCMAMALLLPSSLCLVRGCPGPCPAAAAALLQRRQYGGRRGGGAGDGARGDDKPGVTAKGSSRGAE